MHPLAIIMLAAKLTQEQASLWNTFAFGLVALVLLSAGLMAVCCKLADWYIRKHGLTLVINDDTTDLESFNVAMQGWQVCPACGYELAHAHARSLGSHGTHDRTFAQCFEAILLAAEGVLFTSGSGATQTAADTATAPALELVKVAKPDPTWVCVIKDTNELVARYYRRPSRSRMCGIDRTWVTGRKTETKGKLVYITYSDYLWEKERIDLAQV